MTSWTARDKVAVIGVGTTGFGDLYKTRDKFRSDYDLAAEAFKVALADAGIERGEIDGLLTARVPSYQHMADILGMRRPKLSYGFEQAGRMSALAVQAAINAIATGHCETVALVYGNNGRSVGAQYGGGEPTTPTGQYDAAYGMTSAGAYVALMYERYRQLNNVPDDGLAAVSINNRNHAKLNPNAVMHDELDTKIYMESRFVAEPLRLYDYCLINDGGVALILTSVERAKKLGKPVVAFSGTAACGDLTNFYTSDDYYYESCKNVADRVYQQAGVKPRDIDVAQIYDNFTPTILFSLEGFGFCNRGEAHRWVRDGRIGLGGELPVNTSGGHTSESYMQGWAMHVEAVRQLRGECGARQVKDAEIAQYICAAPVSSSHILRRIA